MVFCAGFCIFCAQVGANAFAAVFYTTANRATGVSWASGIGRIDSVIGSMAGRFMLSVGWSLPFIFLLIAIEAIIAGISLLTIGAGVTRAGSGPEAPVA